ncbi:efflux RND transporter periplasmic adaptor subunit [Phenylobacterium immobile]|uniref:efflux RND transporter periplasmic adaptor subunit n=1 Tax=Phenylobacterium immobile TaxID=21 RepID=UPI000B08F699|nr:HlyD family efflux transporter periplasmic adaptor subunit [Phenylobacterium immobile]
MPFRPEHIAHFQTLASLNPPRVMRVLAAMILIGFVLVAALMFAAPWVQTAPGVGQVVALDPRDRVQELTAMVSGRVEAWYVTDGQQVAEGEPIARIVDNDPDLLARLGAERGQVLAEISAAQAAVDVALLDVDRYRSLHAEGLAARRDLEGTQIRVADLRAKLAESRSKLNRIDVSLSRQAAQVVTAPRDGRIQAINGAAGGSYVSAGTVLATLAPERAVRVVELMLDGRDVVLVRPGQRVRLAFEGWPVIQFSGWPSVARGLFDGQVRSIDPTPQASGLFRVLVEPSSTSSPWPDANFLRIGGKARGWVQMETVSVGYELWRQLNDFPLKFRSPAKEAEAEGYGPKAAVEIKK